MTPTRHRHPGALISAALAAAMLSGCIGYHLGSMLPPDIRTVYIPRFVNKTEEPLIENRTTRAALEAFQTDGSLKVVDRRDADAILKVTLLEYSIAPVSYKSHSETQATEYRITINAQVVLLRRRTDEVIVEYPRVQGEATFQVIGDLSSSKRRGLPAAAQDLAHNIVERIVETW